MSIRLTETMRIVLKGAPEEWRNVSPGPTVEALETRGLVQLRNNPNEPPGMMRGFQWRITETGKVMDGRICACHRQPPDFHS